ncbi:OLC1v1034674C1 [Oldenlandia corymbosa var. corymbosa]|uniref:OLC1v1034674C1 n=1 Tax=Oldenlandia corymbosa var. corymbosa TaxID=529605 RepID=A0AAV1CRV6_OLDCO|nr:OLC1v1034674C1 [Oldenlandia corymbosa var. corymbosa]
MMVYLSYLWKSLEPETTTTEGEGYARLIKYENDKDDDKRMMIDCAWAIDRAMADPRESTWESILKDYISPSIWFSSLTCPFVLTLVYLICLCIAFTIKMHV